MCDYRELYHKAIVAIIVVIAMITVSYIKGERQKGRETEVETEKKRQGGKIEGKGGGREKEKSIREAEEKQGERLRRDRWRAIGGDTEEGDKWERQ